MKNDGAFWNASSFHDVLNTASSLTLLGDILRTVEPEEIPLLADEIDALAERLIGEIEAQRDLSAAENGELAIKPDIVSANAILDEVGQAYSRRASARRKHIDVQLHSQDVTFVSDKTLVKRVLGNMVKNALEAIRKGETVTLRYDVEDGFVVFDVHNPGMIPRHIQLQIFQRSFSTKGEGCGLGTYSIKILTERYLRGRAGFDVSPQDGIHFYVAYPLTWDDI